MYVLFLDDERMPDQVDYVDFPRYDVIFTVRNYHAFVNHINNYGLPKFVCFDHDLHEQHYIAMQLENQSTQDEVVNYGKEKTGLDCAKWLVEYCVKNNYKFPNYVIHSMNVKGNDRIKNYITEAKQTLNI